MPSKQRVVYLGVGGHVVALDFASGGELWRRKIKSSGGFVSICEFEERLLATASGEIWCLERSTGEILWHNRLKGLGQGFVTVAGAEATPALASAIAAAQAQAAAAAAVIAATS